jgi:hypothetical protein
MPTQATTGSNWVVRDFVSSVRIRFFHSLGIQLGLVVFGRFWLFGGKFGVAGY